MTTRVAEVQSRGVSKAVIVFEGLGFVVAVGVCWLTEVFDSPFSWQQLLIETALIALLGAACVWWTIQSVRRVRYLEGFLVLCASCKSVKVDDRWVDIESVLPGEPQLIMSHGICPACAMKLYGENWRKRDAGHTG